MIKSKYFPLAISKFRGYAALGMVLMMATILLSGCANMHQNESAGYSATENSTEFAAMETNPEVIEHQSEGIDLDAYGIDY